MRPSKWARKDPKIPKKARQAGMVSLTHHANPKSNPARARRRKRPPTEAEKAHMDRVRKMKCWACRLLGIPPRPTNLHHIRDSYGASQRASHWEVIPLCEGHHQGMRDTSLFAFHRAERTWAVRFAPEVVILVAVWVELGMDIMTLPELRGDAPPWWPKFISGFYESTTITEDTRRVLTYIEGETA